MYIILWHVHGSTLHYIYGCGETCPWCPPPSHPHPPPPGSYACVLCLCTCSIYVAYNLLGLFNIELRLKSNTLGPFLARV